MKGYTYEAELVKQSILENKRVSKRGLLDSRDITLELNTLQNADGSAILSLGKTKVIAGVKILPDKPYPDTPDE
jgi:exosome complex component RRP42